MARDVGRPDPEPNGRTAPPAIRRVEQTEDYSCVHACVDMLSDEHDQGGLLERFDTAMGTQDAWMLLRGEYDATVFAQEVSARAVNRLAPLADAFLLSVESPLIAADPEAYDEHCRADGRYVVSHAVVLDTTGRTTTLHDPSPRRYWDTWDDYLDDADDYPIRAGFALERRSP